MGLRDYVEECSRVECVCARERESQRERERERMCTPASVAHLPDHDVRVQNTDAR